MAKFQCECDNVLGLDKATYENEYILLARKHIEPLVSKNFGGNLAEYINQNSAIVLMCQRCGRIHLENKSEKYFAPFRPEHNSSNNTHSQNPKPQSDDDTAVPKKIQTFRSMLRQYPELLRFWKFDDNSSLHISATKEELKTLTQRQKIMLQFFIAVWSGGPQNFDFVYAARALEREDKEFVIDWFMNPAVPWSNKPHSYRL